MTFIDQQIHWHHDVVTFTEILLELFVDYFICTRVHIQHQRFMIFAPDSSSANPGNRRQFLPQQPEQTASESHSKDKS